MMMAIAGSFLFLSSTRTESWNIKLLPYIYSLSAILVSLVSLATNKGDGRKQNYLLLYLSENIRLILNF
jgi:hypothetical protein